MGSGKLKGLNWVVGSIVVVLALSLVLALATKDNDGTDAGGLTVGSTASSIVGVAPAGITQEDLDSAAVNEPLATKLAIVANQNRLGINFTWTLVCGFLVMFMQLGFALVETGFCRRKNAFHVMAMNFSVYFLGLIGYFLFGFAFQFGGVGNVGVANLGGLS